MATATTGFQGVAFKRLFDNNDDLSGVTLYTVPTGRFAKVFIEFLNPNGSPGAIITIGGIQYNASSGNTVITRSGNDVSNLRMRVQGGSYIGVTGGLPDFFNLYEGDTIAVSGGSISTGEYHILIEEYNNPA